MRRWLNKGGGVGICVLGTSKVEVEALFADIEVDATIDGPFDGDDATDDQDADDAADPCCPTSESRDLQHIDDEEAGMVRELILVAGRVFFQMS